MTMKMPKMEQKMMRMEMKQMMKRTDDEVQRLFECRCASDRFCCSSTHDGDRKASFHRVFSLLMMLMMLMLRRKEKNVMVMVMVMV